MSVDPCPNCKKEGTLTKPYGYETEGVGIADARYSATPLRARKVIITKTERACLNCGYIESKVDNIETRPNP